MKCRSIKCAKKATVAFEFETKLSAQIAPLIRCGLGQHQYFCLCQEHADLYETKPGAQFIRKLIDDEFLVLEVIVI